MLRQGGIRILHATGRSNGIVGTSHALRSLSPHTSTVSLHEQHPNHHQYHSLSPSPSNSSPLHTNTVHAAVHNNGSARRSAVLSRRWKSNLHKRAARALGKNMKDRKPEDDGNTSSSSSAEGSDSGTVSEMVKNASPVVSTDGGGEKPPPSVSNGSSTDDGGAKMAEIPEMAGEAPLPPPIGHLNEFAPKIVVVGVGGGGGNAVNNMIASQLHGVDFLTLNTDAQHLSTTLTTNRIQIGSTLTSGLGCGANPEAGRLAAEESRTQITDLLQDAHMVFICAGMGGGTGTGAAPVVAEVCYDMGILTVGVVTKPFRFEGTQRMRLAEEGVARLREVVDTLIVIPNQNLFQMADEGTSFVDSFAMADNVLLAGVKSITDLMTTPGLINLDFADVQSVMSGMGNAILGTGQSSHDDVHNSTSTNGANGKNKQSASIERAVAAAEMALANPLLGSNMDIGTAKGMLVNITGGKDMTLFEVDRAAQLITERVEDDHANIIFGSAYDETLEGSVRVSVVATGIEEFVEEK